jgi:hypothetical protein
MAGKTNSLPPEEPQVVLLHWDGHSLTRVDAPTPGISSAFNGISAVSASDIWAVGGMSSAHGRPHSLIEHWDGRHWHIRATPDLTYTNALNGVSAASSDDAYAVGHIRDHRFHDSALTLHWDGTAWTRVS